MAILVCPKCGAKNRVDERAASLQPVCGRCGTKLDPGSAARGSAGAGGMSDKVLEVSDATFDREVLGAGDKPVLVDAWAPWCGPCRLISPIVDQLAAESGGRYRTAKVNIDQNPTIAAKYRIESIPTLLIFKNG